MRREGSSSRGARRPAPWRAGRAAAIAALAAAALSGCGPSLVDARHLPVHVPACTSASEPIACAGAAACVAEDDRHCGETCTDCLASTIQHGSASCDRSSPALDQHVCAVNCEPGFVRDPGGPGCVCDVGQVACAGACVVESATSCGSTCQACSAPAGATATCTDHHCDYLCPGGTVQCTSTSGQPDCCTPACAAPQVECGGACVAEDTTRCGAGCADCTGPGNVIPAHASAACLGSPGRGTCSFACDPGFLKSGGACVQVASGPGTVALGATHTCVVTTAGGVMCWGNNAAGQLGVGDTQNRLAPVSVPLAGGALALALAAGTSHTCAVTTAGAVQCWGSNATAQLAQPVATTPSSSVPVAVPGLTGVALLAAGAGHTCALLQDGRVSCWGANDKAQAGANPATTALVTAPTAVNLAGAMSAIATQVDHTCVIKAGDGHVLCWGANVFGQTGQSPSPTPSVPGAAVSSLVASAIAVGGTHTCAVGSLNNAAGVYCWGDRASGKLGDGLTTPNVNVPQLASRLTPVAGTADRLLTGLSHTCAAQAASGTATCAGDDRFLQAGAAPPLSTVLQGPPIALGAIDALVGGGDRGCALSAGALMCWGANDHGQLGDGTTQETATPVAPRGF